MDRLERIQPFWKQLSHEERLELMTFSTKEVKAQALIATKKIERDAEGKSILQPLETCRECIMQIVAMLTHLLMCILVTLPLMSHQDIRGHKQSSS